jgi:hypothetical protein
LNEALLPNGALLYKTLPPASSKRKCATREFLNLFGSGDLNILNLATSSEKGEFQIYIFLR